MNNNERQAQIITACTLFGVPPDRETAYALVDVASMLHDALDARFDADSAPSDEL